MTKPKPVIRKLKTGAIAGALLFMSSCVSIQKVDREALRSVFRANEKDVRACYEQRLKEMPLLEGKLDIEFDIFPGGKVESPHFIEDRSTIKDETLRACMIAKASKWVFPDPPSGQTLQVSYPYYFSSSAGSTVQPGRRPVTK